MTYLFLVLCALLVQFTGASGQDTSVNEDVDPPAVLWYAPFLSGGGYCSEAHSYVVAVDAALESAAISCDSGQVSAGKFKEREDGYDQGTARSVEQPFELLITQHGDSLNPAFIRDLPLDMQTRLEQHWIEERDFYWRLHHRDIALVICHSEPGAWDPAHYTTSRCPPEGTLYKVGRTMFETDRVPSGWSDRMNKMDEIWVPTRFQEQVFVDGGVRPDAIKVVPEVVDIDFFDPEKVEKAYDLAGKLATNITDKTTVYLSVFKWEERKAWKILLTAYFQAFSASDDVVLVLLTNRYHSTSSSAEDFVKIIDTFTSETIDKPVDELPNVHVLPPHIPQQVLPSLYKAANAFVLPSRGEGWGRPHVEAMAMGLPVIATFWSGTTEYMTQANSYPLDIDGLVEITEGAFRGHKWANPSVKHLQELLLRIKEHPGEAVAKGKRARQDMVGKYSPTVVGEIVLRHISRILKHVAARGDAANDADTREEL
ncbi:unnamed protein product [Hyaloperonospora brassicae]|uniref:Glycosyl transferase family 1 domain-containing protein n=1 Tax=Hyaloperonospora brassicae TaxID=162125 RepID=A0AAV0T730_HYABA|nr:unnamed protein product [Hyaloperonospora brassicae]